MDSKLAVQMYAEKVSVEDVNTILESRLPKELLNPRLSGQSGYLKIDNGMASVGDPLIPDVDKKEIETYGSFHAFIDDAGDVEVQGGDVIILTSVGTNQLSAQEESVAGDTFAFSDGDCIYLTVDVDIDPAGNTYSVGALASGSMPSSSSSISYKIASMETTSAGDDVVIENQASNIYIYGGLVPDAGDEYQVLQKDSVGNAVWDWVRAV